MSDFSDWAPYYDVARQSGAGGPCDEEKEGLVAYKREIWLLQGGDLRVRSQGSKVPL